MVSLVLVFFQQFSNQKSRKEIILKVWKQEKILHPEEYGNEKYQKSKQKEMI